MSIGITATVLCPRPPWPMTYGSAKRTYRLLEAMELAGVRPHLISQEGSEETVRAITGRGWGFDVAREEVPSLAARTRQHLVRRPSPYVADVARLLRERREPGLAFVQVEHAMSSYYADAHPSCPTVLSTHNVDSTMLATIARDARTGTARWAQAWNRSLAMRVTERRAARRADVVVCVSDDDAATFERLGASVLLIPNGVDEELFAIGPAPATGSVLFFGRLDYGPNDHGLRRFLAEIWPRVAAQRPEARLRVVGAGLGAEAARAVAAAPRAEALGLVPDIVVELEGAAVVVVPVWQGGGTRLKVLEALGAARPVVGTTLGVSGIGVRDGVHVLVASATEDFAAATVRLLAEPGAARELGASGRELAGRFRWGAITAPATELYARLADASATRAGRVGSAGWSL